MFVFLSNGLQKKGPLKGTVSVHPFKRVLSVPFKGPVNSVLISQCLTRFGRLEQRKPLY